MGDFLVEYHFFENCALLCLVTRELNTYLGPNFYVFFRCSLLPGKDRVYRLTKVHFYAIIRVEIRFFYIVEL